MSNNVQPTRSDNNNNNTNNQSRSQTMFNPPGPRARLTSLLSLALSVFSANFRSASLSWTFRLTLVRKRNLPKMMILVQMAVVGEVMKSKLSGELIAGILWLPHRTEFAGNRGPIVFIAVKDFFVECCLSDWKISSCGGCGGWWVPRQLQIFWLATRNLIGDADIMISMLEIFHQYAMCRQKDTWSRYQMRYHRSKVDDDDIYV